MSLNRLERLWRSLQGGVAAIGGNELLGPDEFDDATAAGAGGDAPSNKRLRFSPVCQC